MNLPTNYLSIRALAATTIAAMTLAGPAVTGAHGAVTLSALYSFTNAASASSSLALGSNGGFYGATMGNGSNVPGTVFMVASGGGYSNLYVFQGTNNGMPSGPLASSNGTFYGTTYMSVTNGTNNGTIYYGTNNYGTLFSVTDKGVFTTLAAFNGANGANPVGGLVLATNGSYYGVTASGGTYGYGTVFSWSSTAGLATVYSFTGSNDGSYPQAGLVTNQDGNLYGTAYYGGSNSMGTVFQITPANAFNLLAFFSGTNGANPMGLTSVGTNLFGVTFSGGAGNIGTIFSVTTTGSITPLASFDLGNGSSPESPMFYADDGFLYGTTLQGGSNYGLGLVFRISTNGAVGTNMVIPGGATNGITNLSTLSTVFAFNGNNGAYPQAALIEGADYNLYGVTSSGGADGYGNIFKLSGFPPTLLQQPVSQGLKLGSSASFSVQAAGLGNFLNYQWQLDGTNIASTNLPNGESFSGATSSNLTVESEVIYDAGSYSVIISSPGGTVTSAVVTLTVPAPGVAITSPKANWSTNGGTVTVTGTAEVKGGVATDVVTNVMWQLDGGTWTNANPTVIGNWANWTARVNLMVGSNTFMAYGVDPLGNPSPTNSVNIFYVTDSTLALLTNGSGTNKTSFILKPATNLAQGFGYTNLIVGTNYTVTAVPGSNWLFANWTESYLETPVTVTNTLTNNPLKFLMEPDTTLTANFLTNSFLGAKGTYSGLFSATNGVGFGSAGLLQNLVVGTNGTYSGKLYIGATNYAVKGSFNAYGEATNHVTNSLTLVMIFNFTNTPPQLTGWVEQTGNGAFTACLVAEPEAASLTSPENTNAAQYTNSAQYTVLIPPQATNAPGYGYALISNHLGTATVTGTLADGTAFSQTVPISQTGGLPVYAAPYSSGGLLTGLLTLTTNGAPGGGTNPVPQGSLTWIRPSGGRGSLFSSSFTNLVAVQSELWTDKTTNPAIPFASGTLTVSNSSANLIFYVAVSNNNALVKLGSETSQPTESLTGSINPKTGLLSVTFGNVSGKGTSAGAAAVVQYSGSAAGFFTNSTGAGLIALSTNLSTNAPIIYEQPASRNYANGATNYLIVGAIGATPLSYQWMFDGSVISNGANTGLGGSFSGATTSRLTVVIGGIHDAGSYSVIVSNAIGSVTSEVATLTIPAPTITIKTPVSTTTNSPLTVQGTASDKYGLSGVKWQVNGGGWLPAGQSNQWTNWYATVPLTAGSNIFEAYSVDLIGNHSTTNSVTVFYSTDSALKLLTNGPGTNKPGFANKPVTNLPTGLLYSNLVVGRTYTVTAAPNPGFLFSNWTGSFSTNTLTLTNNPLTFLMESNLTLTANFVTNFFLPVAGTYNGLFSATNGVAEETAGMIYNLALKTNGAYSGKLFIAGTNYPLAGGFNLSGAAASAVGPSNAAGGQLQVELSLESAPARRITGTVSNASFTANIIAEASNALPSAEYTMLLTNAATNTPPGEGYALVTNNAGSFTFSGALADGTRFNQTVPASQTEDIPVYASLYGNTGLLLGWVNLTNSEAGLAGNGLTWIRTASNSAPAYPGGFTNTLLVQSSPWTNEWTNLPSRTNSLWPTNLVVSVSGVFVGPALEFTNVALATNNTFRGTNTPNSLYGWITNKTGLVVLTFVNGNDTSTTGVGVVLQNTGVGGGFFTNSTGAFSLTTSNAP